MDAAPAAPLGLTHAAEDGTNLPLLLARSRHASVRSLERYARPGPEAIARHLADTRPGTPATVTNPAPHLAAAAGHGVVDLTLSVHTK